MSTSHRLALCFSGCRRLYSKVTFAWLMRKGTQQSNYLILWIILFLKSWQTPIRLVGLLLEVVWRWGQALVQVGILTVSVSTANRWKHCVAAWHFALMELAEVHRFVMGSESPFVTVYLLAEMTGYGQPRGQTSKALVGLLHQNTDGVLIFPRDKTLPFTVAIAVLQKGSAFLAHPIRVPGGVTAALWLHTWGSAQIQDGALARGTGVVTLQTGTVNLRYWINQTAHATCSLEDDRCLRRLWCESHFLIGLLGHILQKVSGTEMVLTSLQSFFIQYFLVEA